MVAAYSAYVEFSDYGVEYKTYPKATSEATENITFDANGNLYTTTSTGGSNKLNKYAAADYSFEQSIDVPGGFGEFTGITFDGGHRLYIASQGDNAIHVAQADEDFNLALGAVMALAARHSRMRSRTSAQSSGAACPQVGGRAPGAGVS